MPNSQIFARILKVDEEKRLVFGRAVQEVVDKENEVFDYETSKPNFQKWSAEVYADSNGQSYGNIRSMHDNIAAGKVTDIRFEDDDRAIDITGKIVDDNEWKKVLEGVYTGFSIGGKYARKWSAEMDGKLVTRYTAMPSEISMVDRPCISTAKFFEIQKRDGSTDRVMFKGFSAPASATSGVQSYDLEGAKKPKKMHPPTSDMDTDVQGASEVPDSKDPKDDPRSKENPPPKNKKKAKKSEGSEGLTKGLGTVACFFAALRDLKDIAVNIQMEQEAEGDESQLWQQILDEIKKLAAIGGKLAVEEATEAASGEMTDYGAFCYPLYRMAKGIEVLSLRKEGRRNSAADLDLIQKVHDTSCKLGAACMSEDADDDQDDETSDDRKEDSSMTEKVSKGNTVKDEGAKRGSKVTDGDGGKEHSDNEDDKERTTAPVGSHGADRGFSSKRKAKADEDDDEDMDDDEDADEDDDEDDDEEAPTGAKAKKAKKARKMMEARITKSVTEGVLGALKEAGVFKAPAAAAQEAAGRGRSPALLATDKDGTTKALSAEDLQKSVAAPPAHSLFPGEKPEAAHLIKAAQARPMSHDELFK